MILSTFKPFLKRLWTPLLSSARYTRYSAEFNDFLRTSNTTQVSLLPSGTMVGTYKKDIMNACVGFYYDAGSRFETDYERGLAHFIEHIIYKSTCRRTHCDIVKCVNSIGAQFRSFTNRQMSAYYIECHCQDIETCIDILVDCIYNNNFSDKDVKHEKSVVYHEMTDLDSDDTQLVMDYLHAAAFMGTSLSYPVVGKTASVSKFTSDMIKLYKERRLSLNRLAVAAVGNIDHCSFVQAVASRIAPFAVGHCSDTPDYRFTGSDIRYRDDSKSKANIAIAFEAPSFCSKNKVIIDVATAYLGAWDKSMSGGTTDSQFLGRTCSVGHLCDAYRSFYIAYRDIGLFGIHFTTSSLKIDDFVHFVMNEFLNLSFTLAEGEVNRAKRVAKAKILANACMPTNLCHDIGSHLLYKCKHPSLIESITQIDNITAHAVRETCKDLFYDKCPVVAAVGPCEGLLDYTRIRANNYWLRI